MAITKMDLTSRGDLKSALEASGLFDSVSISGNTVQCVKDSETVFEYLWSSAGSLTFHTTASNTITVSSLPLPKNAYISSNGIIIVSAIRVPASDSYHAFLLGTNENGVVSIAAMSATGYNNNSPGRFYTAAIGETANLNRPVTAGYSSIGETPNTSQIVYAPIPTHPTSGVSTIQGAGLCLQTPLSDTCIVDIDGVKWATNGFLMLKE